MVGEEVQHYKGNDPYSYDPEKAKELLKEVAVPAGPGHPAANPEGLPLRGLRRDLHGAAGHGPVEPVPGGGGRILSSFLLSSYKIYSGLIFSNQSS